MKLERQGTVAQPAEADAAQESAEARFLARAERQYALARQHPGEYVVLVDDEVLFHSPDRDAAEVAYEAARGRTDGGYPVLVGPGATSPFIPTIRGRSLSKR